MYDIYDNDFDKAFDEAVEAIEKKEHRLIWADALKRHYAWWRDGGKDNNFFYELADNFDTIVDLQPAVDAVQVVRCKDCEYFVLTSGHRRCDLRCKEMVEPEGFCSWAKRKEE